VGGERSSALVSAEMLHREGIPEYVLWSKMPSTVINIYATLHL
jgi:hypothetical protein